MIPPLTPRPIPPSVSDVLLYDIPLVFIDVETTGCSPRLGDRVIEIALQRWQGGQKVETYQTLIRPVAGEGWRGLRPGITQLTGITTEMLADQPGYGQVAGRVEEMMHEAWVVGHNVQFDLSFLQAEMARAAAGGAKGGAAAVRGGAGVEGGKGGEGVNGGYRLLHEVMGGRGAIDTLRLARRRFGSGGNGLSRLARRLDVVPSGAHRALADVETTVAVMQKLLEPWGGWETPLSIALQPPRQAAKPSAKIGHTLERRPDESGGKRQGDLGITYSEIEQMHPEDDYT